MLDNCLSLPCKNGASCTSSLNKFSCSCLLGFQGYDCSIQINVCNSNPCKNNGTCLASINQFVCSCPLGYMGLDCSIVYDFCQLELIILKFFLFFFPKIKSLIVKIKRSPMQQRNMHKHTRSWICMRMPAWLFRPIL